MAVKNLRIRALYWLRAFTDKRLVREQLEFTVIRDNSTIIERCTAFELIATIKMLDGHPTLLASTPPTSATPLHVWVHCAPVHQ